MVVNMSRGKKTKLAKKRSKEEAKKKQSNADGPKADETSASSTAGNFGLNVFKTDDLNDIRQMLQFDDLTELPPILGAVILGRYDTVKRLLVNGANINSRWTDGSSPLHWAVRSRNLEMVGLLLARGAHPSLAESGGLSPLLTAICSKDWDQNIFIDLWNLVKANRSLCLDSADPSGCNLLHHAVARNWPLLIELLIEQGIPLNEENMQGKTALLFAVELGYLSCVRVLLESNVDIVREDASGYTPFCHALSSFTDRRPGAREVLQEFIEAFNCPDKQTCVESYLKRRIELLEDPVKENCSIERNVILVLEFFIRQIDNGLQILLDLNIFSKLHLILEMRLKSACGIAPLMQLVCVLLLCCRCCRTEPASSSSADQFISSGLASFCLNIISRYQPDLTPNSKMAMTAIGLAVSESDLAKIWALQNVLTIRGYITANSVASCTLDSDWLLDDHHKRIVRQKIRKFQKIILQMVNNQIYSPTLNRSKYSLYQLDCPDVPINIPSHSDERSHSSSNDTLVNSDDFDYPKLKVVMHDFCPSNCSTPKRVLRKTRTIKQRNARHKRDIDIQSTSSASTVLLANLEPNPKSREVRESLLNNDLRLVRSNPASTTVFGLEEICEVNQSRDKNTQKPVDNETKIVNNVETDSENIENESTQDESDVFLWNFTFDKSITCSVKTTNKRDLKDLKIIGRELLKSSNIISLSHSTEKFIDDLVSPWDEEVSSNPTPECQNSDSFQPFCEDIHKDLDTVIKIEKNIFRLEKMFCQIVFKYEHSWMRDRQEGYQGFTGCCGDNEFTAKYGFDYNDQVLGLAETLPVLESEYINHLKDEWYNFMKVVRKEALKNPEDSSKIFQHVEQMLSSHKIRNSTILENTRDELEKYQFENKYHFDSHRSPDKSNSEIVDKSCDRLVRMISESVNTGIISELESMKKSIGVNEEIYNQCDITNVRNFVYDLARSQSEDSPLPEVKKPNKENVVVPLNTRWRVLFDNFVSMPHQQAGNVNVAPQAHRSQFIISAGGNFGDVEFAIGVNGIPLAIKHITPVLAPIIKMYLDNLPSVPHPHLLTPVLEDSILASPLCEYNLGELLMCLKMAGNYADLHCMAQQLLRGLVHLHRLSIVHGNLKPSNVLIDSYGVLKLSEFGLHKILYQSNRPPKSSMIWFARETLQEWEKLGTLSCDSRSDMQVAGMLLYFLLSGGRHPLGLAAEDILSAVRAGRDPAPPAPPPLSDLLASLITSHPLQRPTALEALGHVYFWRPERQWRLVSACARAGAPPRLLPDLDAAAAQCDALGDWPSTLRTVSPELLPESQDVYSSPSALLLLIRQWIERENDSEDWRAWLLALPTLPSALLALIKSAGWSLHPTLSQFFSLPKTS